MVPPRTLVRWSSGALIVAALVSCRREPQPAPQQAPPPPKTETKSAEPQPAHSAAQEPQPARPAPGATTSVFVAEDVDTALKAATTQSGQPQYVAIDDLGERHAEAHKVVPELEKLLKSDDPQARWRAARALGDYGELAAPAAPTLRKLLSDQDQTVRYHAIAALGRVGDRSDETLDALVAAVTSSDGRIARVAIAALRNLKPDPNRVMAALENALESDDAAVTTYALEAVIERGAAAVPVLNAALKRPKTAYLACAAIEQIGPPAADTVPAIVDLLGNTKHSQLRIQALLALAAIGPAAKSSASQVVPLLDYPTDATVPVAAAFALGSIEAADADEPLRKALDNEDNPFLQMIAAWALAKIHPDDEALVKQAVEKLTQGLASKDATLRTAAARGLEMLHAPPEIVAPALLAVADEPDPDVAANVVSALASLGEKIVPKAAQALAKPEFRELAVKVLTKLGPKASGAVDPLVAAMKDAPPPFRTQLQFALAAIGSAAAPATDELAKGLSSDDAGVRESALYALRHIGPGAQAAVPALVAKAGAGESFEALAAAWALAEIAPTNEEVAQKVVPVLVRGMSDPDDRNRTESAIALASFGPAAKSAVDVLAKAAQEDGNAAVREAAEDALKNIQSGR